MAYREALCGLLFFITAAVPRTGAAAEATSVRHSAPPVEDGRFRERLLTFLERAKVQGAGPAEVTSVVVSPGFADFCAQTPAWRAAAKLLETTTLAGGNTAAEARVRAECGARIYMHRTETERRFVVAYAVAGPSDQRLGRHITRRSATVLTVMLLPANSEDRSIRLAAEEALGVRIPTE